MPAIAFSRSVLKKTASGQVAAKAHYIAREGVYSPAVAKVEYMGGTGERLVRDDLIAKDTHHLPQWAGSASEYFRMAEQHERANGVVATEWKFDLPTGLSREAQHALIADVVATMLPRNPVMWALHEPLGLSGQPHPHVHMLWSAREEDGIPRTPSAFFRRWNAAHPEQGGARKTPALNAWHAPIAAKQRYTDLANLHLEWAGDPARLHPGSYRERGLSITPEPKLWPSDSTTYYDKGIVNDRMQKVLDHRAAMAPHRAEEAAHATAYWARRKQALGITAGMPPAVALARVAQGRIVSTPTRRSPDAHAHMVTELHDLTQFLTRVDMEQRIDARHTARGTTRPADAAARLVAEGERLLRPQTRTRAARQSHPTLSAQVRHALQGLGADAPHGGGIHVSLRDTEKEKDYGYSR